MLRLAVPSKGRLQDETFAWFGARGVKLERVGAGREYAGRVAGHPGVQLALLSAGEIPRELRAGRVHMGVTGQDLVAEQGAAPAVSELAVLGFGHADLIVAVPQFWVDVESMDDLDAVAAAFRTRHGHRLRVATKYHALTRAWFRDHDIADYQIVDSRGATEGTVKYETAEVIVDITSTGETLRANHLKILDGSPILESQATLFVSRRAAWETGDREAMRDLCQALGLALPHPAPWT